MRTAIILCALVGAVISYYFAFSLGVGISLFLGVLFETAFWLGLFANKYSKDSK